MTKAHFIFSLVLPLTMLTACRSGTDARVQAAVAETSMASAGGDGLSTVSDVDAAAIARTINHGEIQMAQMALQRASSAEVRQYAQMMIDDHTMANQRLQERGFGDMENAVTQVLKADVTRRMGMMQNLTGMDFDQAYMGSQVDMHQTALETIRTTLQPSANVPELRTHLATMRTSVEGHLEQARRMMAGLGR